MKKARFPARVTDIDLRGGLQNIFVQDERYAYGFGPGGRTDYRPVNFFSYALEGYRPGRQLADYKNFGAAGIAIGVNVWCHYQGSPDIIVLVTPR